MKRLVAPVLGIVAIGFLAGWLDTPPRPAGTDQQAPMAGVVEMLPQLLTFRAMAQEPAHDHLVDVHAEAGVTCVGCHTDGAFSEPVPDAVCTDCHGNYQELAALTPWEPNPHASHLGEIPCAMCHKIHEVSVSFCDECHAFGMRVP